MSEVKTDLSFFDSRLDLNNLDKSNWKTYRFDEIAKNISERVDPNNTDLKVYIGLEHIDSESLHIKRHGTPEDVNGQKLKFYKGDIIFGRRRAYQRKAGIATWDGFCSAHALVLRANPDVIDPELFPFFLHSDLFMNRAVDISVGSLSPTINWGTLKHQEFHLPPIETQHKLSKLLWNSNDVIEAGIATMKKAETLKQSLRTHHFKTVTGDKKLLADIADVRAGHGFPMKYQGKQGEEHKFFKVGDMNLDLNTPVMKVSENSISEQDRLAIKAKVHPKNTIIFPKVGAAIATEKKRILGMDAIVDNNVMGLTVKDEALLPPLYLLEIMEMISLSEIANSGTVPSINAQIIKGIQIKLPKQSLIQDYLNKMSFVNDALDEAFAHYRDSTKLNNTLINKVF